MDEKIFMCGCICMAARHLGFKLTYGFDSGYSYYGWVDLMNSGATMYGDLCDNKQDALYDACLKMQKRLSIYG